MPSHRRAALVRPQHQPRAPLSPIANRASLTTDRRYVVVVVLLARGRRILCCGGRISASVQCSSYNSEFVRTGFVARFLFFIFYSISLLLTRGRRGVSLLRRRRVRLVLCCGAGKVFGSKSLLKIKYFDLGSTFVQFRTCS